MKSTLVPDMVYDKIQDISVSCLKSRGITGVLCDLDNTLAGYYDPLPSDDITQWIKTLTDAGIGFMIVSNNKNRRVAKYCEPLGIKYIVEAKKPKTCGFLEAAKLMDKSPEEIAMIGDQIFTDIRGGNRCGMTTIIVNPVKSDIFFAARVFFSLRRVIETPFILAARKK